MASPSGDNGRLVTFQQTASLAHNLTKRVGMFLEYAGNFARATPPDDVAHTGIAVAIGSLKQVDLHGGLSLNGEHRKPFVGVGFSRRF